MVTFIPIIGFLYLFVSMLEEFGYMARANFVMDRLMKSLGLPGNAFIPMVVGFGCNVPAIMATRTMERPRDRIVAVLMSPFMSCGGRLAVYTVFAAAFFPEHGQFVVFGIYLLGIVFAMITSLLMKFSLLPEERSLHVLTLPSYHWPKLAQCADQRLGPPEDVHLPGRQIHHSAGVSGEDSERLGDGWLLRSQADRAIHAGGGRTRDHADPGADGRRSRTIGRRPSR